MSVHLHSDGVKRDNFFDKYTSKVYKRDAEQVDDKSDNKKESQSHSQYFNRLRYLHCKNEVSGDSFISSSWSSILSRLVLVPKSDLPTY